MSKKIVILPAFNEENSVESLLRKIKQVAESQRWNYQIIACDDGSRDRTAEILSAMQAELPLQILTHKMNRGLGETIRDLIERAAEIADADDVIIRLDCDDSHEPFHITDLVAKLEEGYDVVTASRFQPGGGQLGVRPIAPLSAAARIFLCMLAFAFRVCGNIPADFAPIAAIS